MRLIFRLLALAFAAVALFHLLQAAHVLGDGANAARHLVFVGIDGALAWLILVRPRWLPVPFAALTAQQIASHGGDLVRAWTARHEVEGSDVLVIATMVTTLALLVIDASRAPARRR